MAVSSAPGAGNLDQRVLLERATRADDGVGGAAVTWSPLAEVWAEVWPVGGAERAAAGTVEGAALLRARLRRSAVTAALTTADRLIWRGRAHNIRVVADPGPRAPFLVLDLEAGVAV